MDLSQQFLSEFKLLHSRLDTIESLLRNSAVSTAPKLPSVFPNNIHAETFAPHPLGAKAKAVPILDPTTKTVVPGTTPVISTITPSSVLSESKIIPSKVAESSPKPVKPKITVSSVELLCLFCSTSIIAISNRVASNKSTPQKFCSQNCKKSHKLHQSHLWEPATAKAVEFIPLLDREDIQYVEGPAGTGKSRLALEICENDKSLTGGVMYVTSSWIAAFEFAKKLTNVGLNPYIPAHTSTLTPLAARAKAKEFPTFDNKKGANHITIVISSMTHSSRFSSVKLSEETKNCKTGMLYAKRKWNINDKVELGEKIITLGKVLNVPHTMLIDEAGTVSDALLQTLTIGVNKVVLLGDRFQRKPISDEETLEVYSKYQLSPSDTNSFRLANSDRVTKLTTGFRCPKDIYVLASAFYGYEVNGSESQPSKTVPSSKNDLVAVPTIKSLVKGEFTIDELQGQTCQGLTVKCKTRSDIDFLRAHPESVLVAMTRHTLRFSYIDIYGNTHNVSEFFARFCKKKCPLNHRDASLVEARLLSKLDSPTIVSKPSTTKPPSSDRVVNRVETALTPVVSTHEGGIDQVPKLIPFGILQAVPAGSIPILSDTTESQSPRPIPIGNDLLPRPTNTSSSESEAAYCDSSKASHSMNASSKQTTIPGRNGSGVEVKASQPITPVFIVDEPVKSKPVPISDQVTYESDTDSILSTTTSLSSCSSSIPGLITSPLKRTCPGCSCPYTPGKKRKSLVCDKCNGLRKEILSAFLTKTDCSKTLSFVPTSWTDPQFKHDNHARTLRSRLIGIYRDQSKDVRYNKIFPEFLECQSCHLYCDDCDHMSMKCPSCEYDDDEEKPFTPKQIAQLFGTSKK